MTVRPLKSSDIPILNEYAKASGFEYPEPNDINIVKCLLVADDEDRPVVAVAAKRLVEVFGYFSPNAGASLRVESLDLIHSAMRESLVSLGYDCVEVFVPPRLERRGFGRFLASHFGWHRNWCSWGKRL